MDLLTASESKWVLSRQLMVLTLRRTGRVDATRPKVFLSFFPRIKDQHLMFSVAVRSSLACNLSHV